MAMPVTSHSHRRVINSISRYLIVISAFASLGAATNPLSAKSQLNEHASYEDLSYSGTFYSWIPDYGSVETKNESVITNVPKSINPPNDGPQRYRKDPVPAAARQHQQKQQQRQQQKQQQQQQHQEPSTSWFTLWTPSNREFSFGGLIESVFGAVAGGLNSIVNNVMGNEPKRTRSRPNRVSYKGHQLLRLTPVTKNQIKELLELKSSEVEDVRFWTQPVGNRSTDILVSPDVIPDVKDFLREKKIDFTVLIPDLQKTIAYQNPKMSKEQRTVLVNNQGHSMTWKRYHRFGEILKYLEYLAFRYPNLVELITVGHSFEGQPLKVVKVSSGPAKNGEAKPTIWIDAGMHAREWISTAVSTYILNELVEKNTTYSKLLDTMDWMIMPVVNPDGYEFSHIGDRLWRKTRSNHDNEARYTPAGLYYLVSHYTKWLWARCDGVDPNRNFGYHWGEDKDGGTSENPCHETYAGPYAFSEPETKAMSDFIMANRENIRLYLTLHSYSQMWLVPWGYTYNRPNDYTDLASVAQKGAKAIAKVYGTNYKVGPSADLLYPTAGASDDWAKGVAGIKYSYTLELRDRGTYGFLLPATQIVPTARETWAGIRTIARLVTTAGT